MTATPIRKQSSDKITSLTERHAHRLSLPAVCKCDLCSNTGSFSSHITGIKIMIELSGLDSYRQAA